ncbi:MAG: DUF615 domain-containing protein [Burkholderiales bacterium]|nr:DUF615 domain-containing protein [Burkholderiales bacterium]
MPRADEHPPAAATQPAVPSKTRRKHAMQALQDLGVALVALDPGRLAELDLPERLVDAIGVARGVRAHEGRRRQLQYVGKLMRDVDPEPIHAALARWASGVPADQVLFAAAEHWRATLLADDAALDGFVAEHPAADRAALAGLVRDARSERARGGPPHRFRQLFRALKAAMETDA